MGFIPIADGGGFCLTAMGMRDCPKTLEESHSELAKNLRTFKFVLFSRLGDASLRSA